MSYSYSLLHDAVNLWLITAVTLFTATLSLCPVPSIAEQANKDYLDKVEVFEVDGVYHINFSSQIDASHDHVRKVITDYVHIYRLSDSIIESKVSNNKHNGKIQVETLVLCCVPVFCREVTRLEEIDELEPGHIQTVIIPGKSDFLSGETKWLIEPSGQSTLLSYQARLEPDFYIPPLLGTEMVINNMRKEFSITVNRIEHIARINEEKEWETNFNYLALDSQDDETKCTSEVRADLR